MADIIGHPLNLTYSKVVQSKLARTERGRQMMAARHVYATRAKYDNDDLDMVWVGVKPLADLSGRRRLLIDMDEQTLETFQRYLFEQDGPALNALAERVITALRDNKAYTLFALETPDA